ncbi:MAG TPA: hypothetical protein VH478_22295 [Trebonia sp.]|nr:hypothetical protein [Trebonia sp.]
MSERSSRESRRQAIGQARQQEARRKRRLRLAAWGGAAIVVAGAGIGIGLGVSGGSSGSPGSAGAGSFAPLSSLGPLRAAPSPGPLGPEQVPVPDAPALAAVSPKTTGQAIDGISCDTSEQTLFHIHTHLTIFVNGQQRSVPAAIGIPGGTPTQSQQGPFIETGNCFYWLHTHAADGIVHIESPVKRTFTLGDFFDEWGQPLTASQAGPARGKVTVTVNGQVFTGNPRDVALGSHENLQVQVGTPLVQPATIDWSDTGL